MRYSATIVFVVLLLSVPPTAWASDACTCTYSGGDSLGYGDAAEGLPTNLHVFVDGLADRQSLSFAKVVNGMSEPVAFHFEDFNDGSGAAWMVPDALFDPMTSYEYIRGEFHHGFTTGMGEDTIAPTFTSAAFQSLAMGGACESHLAALLRAEGEVDDTAPPGLWTWRATIQSPAKVIYFSPTTVRYLGRMDIDDTSWDTCLSNFPAAELDKTFNATIVAFDWAGNVSKEVTTSFEFAEGGASCGCRMVGENGSSVQGVYFLSALALVMVRLRKSTAQRRPARA